jgi:hypothetical protein
LILDILDILDSQSQPSALPQLTTTGGRECCSIKERFVSIHRLLPWQFLSFLSRRDLAPSVSFNSAVGRFLSRTTANATATVNLAFFCRQPPSVNYGGH